MTVAQTINQQEQAVDQLIALAWFDKEFYERLLNNTAEVLREAGVAIEDFAKVVINQSPKQVPGLRMAALGEYEICLPPQPTGLTSEQLIAGNQDSSSFSLPVCMGCYCTLS